MNVPTDVSWNRLIRVLKKAGFTVMREGRHTSMIKDDRIIIVPRHKRIKRETLREIIRDSGLGLEKFKSLL